MLGSKDDRMLLFVLKRLLYVCRSRSAFRSSALRWSISRPEGRRARSFPTIRRRPIAAQIREAYGFDKPPPVQYLLWLRRVLTGDFGMSITTRRTVISEVMPAMLNTFKLAGGAILLACIAGSRSERSEPIATEGSPTASSARSASPAYQCRNIGWAWCWWCCSRSIWESCRRPEWARPSPGIWDQFSHLILPTLTLAVVPAGLIARSVRSTVGEILDQEFVQTLHANGLPPSRVFLHVIKNAAPPALAVIGLEFARLLGGSILVETVFSWPGTGFLLNSAIFMRDLPVVQGTVLGLAMFFVLTNVLVDILQMAVRPAFQTRPRSRRSRAMTDQRARAAGGGNAPTWVRRRRQLLGRSGDAAVTRPGDVDLRRDPHCDRARWRSSPPCSASKTLDKTSIVRRLKPPGTPGYPLGTDELGRDLLTRLIYGGRLSLLMGFMPVLIATLVAERSGSSRAMRAASSIPPSCAPWTSSTPSLGLLAVAISGVLGGGVINGLISLTLIFIPSIARVSESVTMQVGTQDFVDAARATGAYPIRSCSAMC